MIAAIDRTHDTTLVTHNTRELPGRRSETHQLERGTLMNLLTDPLFRVETPCGPQRMHLPGLLTALGQGQVESLSGLQRHQEDAFHIFLCQLAASVLAREGESNPQQDEMFWRDSIRRLTGPRG